ncbi:MAG: hypothetical protein AB7O62_14000 [Pirellulales bacterium]
MLHWFLRTIGATDDFVTHLEDVSLAFHSAEVLWLLLLLPFAGWFIYARQRNNLVTVPRKLVSALTSTRVFVLAMLVFILAGPYLKLHHEYEKRPIVALLFDQSQSMQLPAGPYEDAQLLPIAKAAGYQTSGEQIDAEARKALNRIARAKLAQTVVQNSRKELLEPLSEKYDLKFYSFSREALPISVDSKTLELPEPPSPGGPSSYLGDAVSTVLEEAAGRPIAGIVLFSDGVNTGGVSPSEIALAAAHISAPIFSVPAGDSKRKADVAIVDLFATGLVSVGDQVRVSATIESQGFEGRPVKVELRDGKTVLDSKDLVLHNEQQQIDLTFKATSPGPRYLNVVVPPQPEEPEELHDNNTDTAFVRVSDEKIKVLFVDGTPRWDFRFLKNAMRRDNGLAGRTEKEPDIAVETELRRRPEGAASIFPTKIDDLAEYHTIILGDVSPSLLHEGALKLLNEAVRDRGVGLIIEAGPNAMPHRFGSELTDLLPVKLQPKSSGSEAEVYKPFKLELTPEGGIHDAMRLYDDPGRTANVWTQMPPYYWSAAVQRAAPGASVLAVNPNSQGRWGKLPLISYHYAGAGRVMFVGTDSTFLWRQNVGDRFFYRFWGQAVRFVARRNESEQNKSRIEVRPVRAQPGEEAMIDLYAYSADGTPRLEPRLPVTISSAGAPQTVELVEDPATKGRFTGGFTPQESGDYKITFQSGAEPVEAQFRVMTAPEELRHPHVDRVALTQLASSSGGRMVEISDLATIPPDLKGETKTASLDRQKDAWDNWLTLVLLVCVYSLDVGLRRLAGLS